MLGVVLCPRPRYACTQRRHLSLHGKSMSGQDLVGGVARLRQARLFALGVSLVHILVCLTHCLGAKTVHQNKATVSCWYTTRLCCRCLLSLRLTQDWSYAN